MGKRVISILGWKLTLRLKQAALKKDEDEPRLFAKSADVKGSFQLKNRVQGIRLWINRL
jgi:hypothetical protein